MFIAIKMKPEPLRSLAFGSIGATYAGVGTTLTHSARIIIIQNNTDADLLFSLDGVNDHFFLPSSGQLIVDLTSNKTIENGFFLAEGERLYVKQSGIPSSGSVYFSVLYGAIQ